MSFYHCVTFPPSLASIWSDTDSCLAIVSFSIQRLDLAGSPLAEGRELQEQRLLGGLCSFSGPSARHYRHHFDLASIFAPSAAYNSSCSSRFSAASDVIR